MKLFANVRGQMRKTMTRSGTQTLLLRKQWLLSRGEAATNGNSLHQSVAQKKRKSHGKRKVLHDFCLLLSVPFDSVRVSVTFALWLDRTQFLRSLSAERTCRTGGPLTAAFRGINSLQNSWAKSNDFIRRRRTSEAIEECNRNGFIRCDPPAPEWHSSSMSNRAIEGGNERFQWMKLSWTWPPPLQHPLEHRSALTLIPLIPRQ